MQHATNDNTGLGADWRLLAFGFLFMFWSSPGQTYLISLYGAEFRAEFDLSHGDLGGLYSLGTLASAVLLIRTGRWVDQTSLLVLALGLSVALVLACGYISFSAGPIGLAIAFFLLRHSGQGLMSHVATTCMSRYFVAARGRATAVASVGFTAAEACLPALSLALIAALGWRQAWRVTGLVALIVLLPSVWYLLRNHRHRHRRYLRSLVSGRRHTDPKRGPTTTVASRRQWTRAAVLRDRRFYLAMPAFLSPSIFFTGFFFHQVHLVNTKGWDLSWWGVLFSVYAAAALVSTLLTGYLVDRYGAVRLLPLFPLPLAAGLLLLSLGNAPALAVAFLILTGATAGWSVTVMGPFWAELYGVLHLGAIKALGSALMVFGSALSPFLLGRLFDAGLSLDALMLASSLYILLACGVAGFAVLPRTGA